MRLVKVWDDPTPPEAIFLEKSDVTNGMCLPRKPFVSEVAQRLLRSRWNRPPIIGVIPNTRQVLKTRERVFRFQDHLWRRLESYLEATAPHVLRCQPFIDMPPMQAHEIYAVARRTSESEAVVPGLDSYRFWHMDAWNVLFSSICYSRATGVRGGYPRFLDLQGLARSCGVSVRTLMDVRHTETEFSFPNERWAWLRKEYRPFADDHAVQIVGLNPSRDMPIGFFSNRVQDCTMHGASEFEVTGKYPARSLRYISIAYE